jgi:F0F1-type ATP synthase assembly protein I
MPEKRPELNMLVKLLNLGSIIFALALLGFWLDQKFHTLPLWMVIGIIAGMLYSFYEAWQIHRHSEAKPKNLKAP